MGRTFADRSSNVDIVVMIRALRNIAYHLLGYLIATLLLMPYAFATVLPKTPILGWQYSWGGGLYAPSVAAVCASDIALPSWPTTHTYACANVIQPASVVGNQGSYTVVATAKVGGATSNTGRTSIYAALCPVNFTYSAATNMCIPNLVTCTPPLVLNLVTNTCGNPCPSSGTVYSQGYYLLGTSPTARVVSYACAHGCEVTFSGTSPAASALVSAIRNYYASGAYHYLGTSCASGSSPTSSIGTSVPYDTCGSNQVSGTVNNQLVCIDKTTGNQVSEAPKTTKSSTTVSNPDSSTTRTTTEVDENGHTTTTKDTWAPGTSPATSPPSHTETTRSAVDPSQEINPNEEFCTANPNAPMCTHFCSLAENASKVQCLDLGEIGTEQGLETKSFGVTSITPVTFASATGCPAPIPLPNNTEFSFQWSCDFLEALKPMLLALAWLSAGLITVGAFRES